MNFHYVVEMTDKPTTVGARIKFVRDAMDLTQQEFADALSEKIREMGGDGRPEKLSRGAVANWERDQGITDRNKAAVVALAKVTYGWLMSGDDPQPSEAELRRRGDPYRPTVVKPRMKSGFRDFGSAGVVPGATIHVLGQAAGATLDDGASIMFDQQPIGELPMLPGLVGIRDLYGLEVTGTSMQPMFRHGDPIYVSPHHPVAKDDPVVVIEHKSRNGEPLAFIKLWVRESTDAVVVRQLNPSLEMTFLKRPGLSVHRVIPFREAIGYTGFEPDSQTALFQARTPRR